MRDMETWLWHHEKICVFQRCILSQAKRNPPAFLQCTPAMVPKDFLLQGRRAQQADNQTNETMNETFRMSPSDDSFSTSHFSDSDLADRRMLFLGILAAKTGILFLILESVWTACILSHEW